MNIAVIVIDTLRYDYVGANGNDWIKTPNMDRLASESWVFDRCYSASYPTLPHRTDVLTGTYGSPFHQWTPLPFDVLTLPEVLAQAGYCTQLIHDTPHLVNGGHNFDWPFHAWTFIRGAEVDRPWIDSLEGPLENWQRDPVFDFFDEKLRAGVSPKLQKVVQSTILTYSRANRRRTKDEDWNCAKLFLTASQWLRDNSSRDNFFLWVDCFDPHEPWDTPPEFVKMYEHTPGYDGRIDPRSFFVTNAAGISEAATNRMRAFYAAKVSWVDRWLGVFLDTLDVTGLAKNTAIVLTSDHGTNVGERGVFHKSYPVREQEGHVPLMVRVPGESGGRSSMIVQPQDIFATVLGLAGCDLPDGFDCHDAVALARSGGQGKREVALAGPSTDRNPEAPENEKILFTVFDDEWYLELAAKRSCCRLSRYGSTDNVTNDAVVERLHAAGIDEIERRGAAPALVEWLRSEGERAFPQECRFWSRFEGPPEYGPPGYTSFFFRLYGKP